MVVVALVVGAGLYVGLTAVEDALRPGQAGDLDGEVVVAGTTMHLDRVGRPTAVGEVRNGLDEPVDDVRVTVTFTRRNGERAAVEGRPLIPTIPPGGRAPFVVRLADRSAEPTAVEADVTYGTGAPSPYDGLAVVEHAVTDRSESQVTVNGRVENRGGERVGARLVATFYDANGSVVGVRSVPTSPRALGPGEAGEFEVRLRTLGNVPSRAGEVASYELSLVAEEPS